MNNLRLIFALLWCLTLVAGADEIVSNGKGGGKWADPASWEGNQVPTAEQTVIIATGDKITFNAGPAGEKPHCASLQLDPESILDFEVAAGKQQLRIRGELTIHGQLRMDGTLSPDDQLELLIDATETTQAVVLDRGATLSLAGYPGLPDNRRNVVLARTERPEGTQPVVLTASTGCAIDIKDSAIETFFMEFNGINNTGLRPNERLNLINNRFLHSNVSFRRCDTPRFVRNEMEATHRTSFALHFVYSTLPEVVGNRIEGYSRGMVLESSTLNLSRNSVSGGTLGVHVGMGEVTLREMSVKGCVTGFSLYSARVTLEGVSIEGYTTGINTSRNNTNLINVSFTPATEGEKPVDIRQDLGSLTVLNTNVNPERIEVSRIAQDVETPVTAMSYLVVGVKGTPPPDAQIMVEPVNAKVAGPYDIRNAPAPLRTNGLTPLPRNVDVLAVNAWTIGRDKKVKPAQPYKVSLIQPAKEENAKPKELKGTTLTPDASWYRTDLDDVTPTVELAL